MRKLLTTLSVATALALTVSIGAAQDRRQLPRSAPTLVHSHEAGFKEVAPGVSKAVLWEGPDKQSYGAWIKFEPRTDAGLHTYTKDIWIVVIHGAYVYSDGAGEKRVGPGDYIRIPGGTKHRGSGDANWGALFYEESSASAVTSSADDAQSRQQPPKGAPTFVSVDEARFTEVAPGVSKVVLWGDQNKGPYGAFTKFDPEFDAGRHTHTSDVWIVVTQGFYLYNDDAGEKRLGAGDFMRIPAGTEHRSGGDKKWGVIFYEASHGKFDFVPERGIGVGR